MLDFYPTWDECKIQALLWPSGIQSLSEFLAAQLQGHQAAHFFPVEQIKRIFCDN